MSQPSIRGVYCISGSNNLPQGGSCSNTVSSPHNRQTTKRPPSHRVFGLLRSTFPHFHPSISSPGFDNNAATSERVAQGAPWHPGPSLVFVSSNFGLASLARTLATTSPRSVRKGTSRHNRLPANPPTSTILIDFPVLPYHRHATPPLLQKAPPFLPFPSPNVRHIRTDVVDGFHRTPAARPLRLPPLHPRSGSRVSGGGGTLGDGAGAEN
jgi:hypothetical protein